MSTTLLSQISQNPASSSGQVPCTLLHSDIFPTQRLDFQSGSPEVVVLGGRDKFRLVGSAFDNAGIRQILVIGWGSQGPAQAQNLRDTLAHIGRAGIKVCVGLRPGSKSIPAANAAGFTSEAGTLGDPFALAAQSDLIICLVADGAMVEMYDDLLAAAKPGAIIGISHGFIAGYLKSTGRSLPDNHDLIMVAPKGMGPSVRDLYLQGAETAGAGINSSIAIHACDPARQSLVTEVACAWSVGIGSPVTFLTTFQSEVTSDLFGERAILLGGLWGITEALYDYYTACSYDEGVAFKFGVSGLTGTVTQALSELGIKGFYTGLNETERSHFDQGYTLSYPVCLGIHGAIYENVASGQEIRDVIAATQQLSTKQMTSVESSPMWTLARRLGWYGQTVSMCKELAFSAGVYLGGMMSQINLLQEKGHPVSEGVNESFIEAIDSLTPFMHSRGVAYMIDSCSTTARLGARRYGPQYKAALTKVLNMRRVVRPHELEVLEDTLLDPSLDHDIQACFALRPSVRIDVPLK